MSHHDSLSPNLHNLKRFDAKVLPAWALRAEEEWGFSAALLVRNNPHLETQHVLHPSPLFDTVIVCASILILSLLSIYDF